MWSIIVVGATWCHCFERLSQITPHHWPNTSSTAQGGGGSFKHRKPIGEVGCCESGMAERSHWWIEWWLMSPLFLSLFLSFSDYLSTYLPAYLSFYLSISLSLCLSVYLFICLYILIIYLSICKTENEAILRDVLKFWTWQHQKRSNSARLPQSLNLTTSKTKQFCETSSFFKVDNIQNEAILRDIHNIPTWQRQKRSSSATFPHFSKLKTSRTKQFLRDFLQKWKVACSADSLVPLSFAIFPIHLSKLYTCHEKVMPGHTKCCTCHAKSSQQIWRSDAPKCNPSQEITAQTSQQL